MSGSNDIIDKFLYRKNYMKIYMKVYNKKYKLTHKEAQKRYNRTRKQKPQYKLYQKYWYQTPKGKASKKIYQQSFKGKIISKVDAHNRRLLTKDLTIKTIQQVYEDNIKKYSTLTCYLCLKPI